MKLAVKDIDLHPQTLRALSNSPIAGVWTAHLDAVPDIHNAGLTPLVAASGCLATESLTKVIADLTPWAEALVACDEKIISYTDISAATPPQSTALLAYKPTLHEEDYALYGQKVTLLTRQLMEKFDVHLVMTPAAGTIMHSAQEMNTLLETTTPEVQLVLNTAEAALADSDAITLARRFGTRLAAIVCEGIHLPAQTDTLTYQDIAQYRCSLASWTQYQVLYQQAKRTKFKGFFVLAADDLEMLGKVLAPLVSTQTASLDSVCPDEMV